MNPRGGSAAAYEKGSAAAYEKGIRTFIMLFAKNTLERGMPWALYHKRRRGITFLWTLRRGFRAAKGGRTPAGA